jgi:glycosyltransferase involved in cell wall biosynthesis
MEKKMHLSIAMATYNGEAYIRAQLDSLAKQTLLPKELVVCDDGSNDRTLEIVEQFSTTAPFPVHIHRNEKRLGFADNFLQAASLCKGNLIAFCDQDDVWLPEKLEYCQALFIYEPALMLLSHNAWVTDEKLSKIKLLSSRKTCTYARGEFQPLSNPLMGFTQVFRKELVHDIPWQARPTAEAYVQSKTPGCLMPHDCWIAIVASSLGKVMVRDTVFAFYRQHGKNAVGLEQNSKVKIQGIRNRLQWITSIQVNNYLEFRARYQECADSLENVSRQVASVYASRLLEAAETYRKIAVAFGAREALYAENLNVCQKAQRLSKLAIQRAYSKPQDGGLGLKYFFKDLVYATMAQTLLGCVVGPPCPPILGGEAPLACSKPQMPTPRTASDLQSPP